ncbi:ead/Ea22-like family protein [Shigella sonnei]|nr:ead/Ea22-like family protein [Shigella sonnei]EIH7475466.1 ead/Ea22-like family protein [Escherichia coli]
MSEIDYQALRERYSPKPVPECSVCGEEMSIQRISGAHVVYACSGEGDDGYFKIGRTFADEHYEKSRVTVVDDSDPDVIALLDELEAAKSKLNEQREYYEGVIADGSNHIAELEKQCAEWERKELSNFEECAAMAERIEELEKTTTGQDANINSQQERVAQSANRHVYHYNAVSNVSGITMSGIAQSPFRIKSQSDLEEFKSALSKVCGFHATAVTSLSYLGREEEGQNDEKP